MELDGNCWKEENKMRVELFVDHLTGTGEDVDVVCLRMCAEHRRDHSWSKRVSIFLIMECTSFARQEYKRLGLCEIPVDLCAGFGRVGTREKIWIY
jgi:hypothetical protein